MRPSPLTNKIKSARTKSSKPDKEADHHDPPDNDFLEAILSSKSPQRKKVTPSKRPEKDNVQIMMLKNTTNPSINITALQLIMTDSEMSATDSDHSVDSQDEVKMRGRAIMKFQCPIRNAVREIKKEMTTRYNKRDRELEHRIQCIGHSEAHLHSNKGNQDIRRLFLATD